MEDTDGPAPAIDPHRILPSLIRDCLSEGQAADLALDHQFMTTRFRAHQIIRLIEFASTEFYIDLATRPLARAFDISHSAVTHAKLRGYEHRPGRGRHYEHAIESEQALVDWLMSRQQTTWR
jgi:hypothetical protein